MSIKCTKCDIDLNPEKEISCDLCRKYIHSTCSSLSRLEIQCLKSKDRKIIFYCETCSDFKSQLGKLNDLNETVQKLETKLKTLQDNLTLPKTEAEIKITTENVTTQVVDELLDRQSRERNILIFNLEETETGNIEDRNAIEKTKLTEILSSIDNQININNLQFMRLGRYSQDKTRPLKIILPSKHDVLNILKNKRKLNLNVGIQADLTVMQRNHLKNLRSKLEEINKNGGNKTIRYINGSPQIVNAKN